MIPLVMRFGAMGDMVLLIPILKALHQRYGQPCELISSGSWTTPLMQRVPACGTLHLLTSRRAPYFFNRSQRDLVHHLRNRPEGPVYVFETDEKSHELLRRAKIKPEWICSLREQPAVTNEHIIHQSAKLAQQTPTALSGDANFSVSTMTLPDARPTLQDADRRDCSDWLKQRGLTSGPLILLQPGNKKTMKGGSRQRSSNVDYWPEASWAKVIESLRELVPHARIIICGVPSERPLAQDIVTRVSGSRGIIHIATDELPIPRLLALQERADSLISVNTGPAHSAAAMGCPSVVMFTRHAHRAATLYAPIATTAPVRILLPEVEAADADLSSITSSDVIAAWKELGTLVEAGASREGCYLSSALSA
jgi:heptosyltransferase-3